MKKYGIILDDGHGIDTPGKRSPIFQEDTEINGILFKEGECFVENKFNLAVVKILKRELENVYEVRESAPSILDVPLKQRMVNEAKYYEEFKKMGLTSLFISIHANAHQPINAKTGVSDLTWNNAQGIETFHYTGSRLGKELATFIQRATSDLGPRDRGVKSSNYYVLRKSKSIAVLYEGGFMTNKQELGLLADPKFQEKTAQAIIQGIRQFIRWNV
jgi:N-acetylmuramoyl-L-alanine amidase